LESREKSKKLGGKCLMAKGKSVLKKIKRPARVGFLCYLGDVQG